MNALIISGAVIYSTLTIAFVLSACKISARADREMLEEAEAAMKQPD